MTIFEPRISGVRYDHSTNCATTTAHSPKKILFKYTRWCILDMILVVNLIKHLTIIIYDSRVALTRKLPILRP